MDALLNIKGHRVWTRSLAPPALHLNASGRQRVALVDEEPS